MLVIDNATQDDYDIGYNTDTMLFYKDTGEASQEVWDVFLYNSVLRYHHEKDKQAFLDAHKNGDSRLKKEIHAKHYSETVAALQKHVQNVLDLLETLLDKAANESTALPRLDLIMRYNRFVKLIFLQVQSRLSSLGL